MGWRANGNDGTLKPSWLKMAIRGAFDQPSRWKPLSAACDQEPDRLRLVEAEMTSSHSPLWIDGDNLQRASRFGVPWSILFAGALARIVGGDLEKREV